MSNYPQKWEICCRCKGEGKHDHPAFANGITQSEMRGMDSYFAGHYDVRCDACDGSGKVRVTDVDAMTSAERAQWDAEAGERREEAEAARYIAAERRAEQRMGC
jgi:RecJ-like exonuclease